MVLTSLFKPLHDYLMSPKFSRISLSRHALFPPSRITHVLVLRPRRSYFRPQTSSLADYVSDFSRFHWWASVLCRCGGKCVAKGEVLVLSCSHTLATGFVDMFATQSAFHGFEYIMMASTQLAMCFSIMHKYQTIVHPTSLLSSRLR